MAGLGVFVNGGTISVATLATAISRLFRVRATEVDVILTEDRDWFANSDRYRVLCVVREVAGDFSTRLDIIPLQASLLPHDALEIIGRLCEILKRHALVPYGDESMNPYSWTLVRGVQDYYHVKVDPDLLDDEENYGLKIAILEGRQEAGSTNDEA
jgi:hypothetical protein